VRDRLYPATFAERWVDRAPLVKWAVAHPGALRSHAIECRPSGPREIQKPGTPTDGPSIGSRSWVSARSHRLFHRLSVLSSFTSARRTEAPDSERNGGCSIMSVCTGANGIYCRGRGSDRTRGRLIFEKRRIAGCGVTNSRL